MTAAAKREKTEDGELDKLILNEGQEIAKAEILKACKPKRRHLLTGNAGSGKTTLLQEVVRDMLAKGKNIAVTAPTHKAVAVLSAKMRAAGVDVPCLTAHSFLEAVMNHG